MKTLASSTEPSTTTAFSPAPMSRGCLALNASNEPIEVLPLTRAIRLVLDGRAEVVEVDGTRVIRSAGTEMPAPAVIRLVRNIRVPRNLRRGVTNTFLFARDNRRCGYCGRHESELGSRDFLTRDHIIPQAWFRKHGGESNTWGNCIAACRSCNGRKADRTLEEAGMELLWEPTEPHFVRLVWTVRRLTPLQKKYIARFFGEDVLDSLR